MRLAYADPPYPGCSDLYADHPDYAGEVDHAALIDRLETYDAWVLHTNAHGLREVLTLCPPDVRVLAWVKGWASFKAGVPVKYAWEPVIIQRPRRRELRLPTIRDWLMCNVETSQTGATVIGQKPAALIRWIFEVMALEPDDELDDLFPGSGAVGRTWELWRNQLRLTV